MVVVVVVVVVVADRELIRVNFVRRGSGATALRIGEERRGTAVQRLCPVVILAPAPSDVHPRRHRFKPPPARPRPTSCCGRASAFYAASV